jgi:predicted transposase YdaD
VVIQFYLISNGYLLITHYLNKMRESVIYQEILKEGLKQGLEQGERAIVLRLLNRRVGNLPQDVRERVETLSLEQLENLSEALLDFNAIADLEVWFSTLP